MIYIKSLSTCTGDFPLVFSSSLFLFHVKIGDLSGLGRRRSTTVRWRHSESVRKPTQDVARFFFRFFFSFLSVVVFPCRYDWGLLVVWFFLFLFLSQHQLNKRKAVVPIERSSCLLLYIDAYHRWWPFRERATDCFLTGLLPSPPYLAPSPVA